MSGEYKVVSSGDIVPVKRKGPVERILDSLEGNYKTYPEMAAHVGVHVETMRRLCRTDKVKAPSEAVRTGDLVIYLFNEKDVAEIEEFYTKKGYTVGDK